MKNLFFAALMVLSFGANGATQVELTTQVKGVLPAANGGTGNTSAAANALNSATTTVNVSSAAAPTAGQVLTATSSTAATWQAGGGTPDASTVTYTPVGTGTVATNVKAKIDQRQSVADWMTSAQYADGQTGTPVLNVAAAFTLAAQNAKSGIDISSAGTIVHAQIARILVPPGKWTLGSLVDTGGKFVIWEFDAGAYVTDYTNINGKIEYPGQRVTSYTNSFSDYGAAYSIITNSDPNYGAAVNGFNSPANLGTFDSRDSVGLFVDNSSLANAITIASATYTATTILPVTPLTADQVKLLQPGIIIDTNHSPTKYSGIITSWAANGASITVSGWYLSPGPGTPATPSNTGSPGAAVNPITKIWAMNANAILNSASPTLKSTGFELGAVNNKAQPASQNSTPLMWGFDSVNLGTFTTDTAFKARNDWFIGFHSTAISPSTGPRVGFQYDNGPAGAGTGYQYTGVGNLALAYNNTGQQTFVFTNAANLSWEYGNLLSATTPYMDFHSSGNNIDFDTRLLASGGTGVAGNGSMNFYGAAFVLQPGAALSTTAPLIISTAPTIASGFGTTPSILANGTGAFKITVGTGGTASTGTLTMPAAANGWACNLQDLTNGLPFRVVQSTTTTTSVLVYGVNTTTGSPAAWAAGTVLVGSCMAY